MSADLKPLTFAVPKGRILDEALPLMERAGVVPDAEFHDKKSRALSFACENSDMRIIRVRAFDVATFVAHGAAQAGIVGSDVVEEFAYADLYAPVDLDIGHCRLSVAEPAGDLQADCNGTASRWTWDAMPCPCSTPAAARKTSRRQPHSSPDARPW